MIRSTSSLARTVTFLGAAALGSAAIGCSGAGDASGAKHPLIGAAAPELGAVAVSGEGPTTLKDAQGKVVLLDFWATFCEPCKKSFPKYQAIAEQFPNDVAVIAVSVDDPESTTTEQLPEFAAENHARFAIVWDKDRSAVEKYGMRSLTMPSMFLIDRAGIVRRLHVGFTEGEETKITAEVKALISK